MFTFLPPPARQHLRKGGLPCGWRHRDRSRVAPRDSLEVLAHERHAIDRLDLGRDEIASALKHLGLTYRFKVVFGEVKAAPKPVEKQSPKEDEVTGRALAHPEVQKFRELFGGEVRAVKNLKEPWNE